MISQIEQRFLEVTELKQDISSFPVKELVQFPIRKDLSKSHGEVFTPVSLIDEMIEKSKPTSNCFNLDLCAGRGQFTVRMIRMFHEQIPDFNIKEYLTNYHWFNEINTESCHEIIYIFGSYINLAMGPAQELKNYPETEGIWHKGVHIWDENSHQWIKSDYTLQMNVVKSNALF